MWKGPVFSSCKSSFPSSTAFSGNFNSSSPTIARTTSSKIWSQYVLGGLQDFLHVLSADGRIRFVSDSCQSTVGYKPTELLGQPINNFIHPDDTAIFFDDLNDTIQHGKPARLIYRFRSAGGGWTILESQCNVYHDGDLNNTSRHRELIIVARPYFTNSRALWDSFLEQKIIGERLMQQIADLKQEEQESDGSQATAKEAPLNIQCIAAVQTQPISNDQVVHQVEATIYCPTPTKYWASAGLRDEGPQNVPAGTMADFAIGDIGIAINRETRDVAKRRVEKKRKLKEPYICRFCGTLESPEWRKGPHGAKTLCNACGLRWSKNSRKSTQQSSNEGPDISQSSSAQLVTN